MKKYLIGSAGLFWLIHLACLGAFIIPFKWKYVGLALGMYALRMFFVTGGYHRYFSHRTYQTSRVVQCLLAFMAETSGQKGIIWWATHHRHHHRFSDTEHDIHSPIEGFWWSHVGWVLSPDYDKLPEGPAKDLAKYPELRWLDKHHWFPPLAFFVTTALLGGWAGVIWGFCVSTVLLWHGTFTINSLSHVWGTRRFQTKDTSRNNLILALITLGEGWHNNHHRFQAAVRQGIKWWEIDCTYYILRGLSLIGVIWNLHQIPKNLL